MLKLASQSYLRRSFSVSHIRLSGHNKWSKIKQKKGVMDAQKGAIYGKANRDIVLAVRTGGSADPSKNLTLAAVLKRAKDQDVPKENIEKALAKATTGKDKGGDSLTYEALAYNSIGVIVECVSDNATRTIHSIREVLNAHNARFAPVGFMFQRKGFVKVALNKTQSEDVDARLERLIETALEAGAIDFDNTLPTEDVVEVELTCAPTDLAKLTSALTISNEAREQNLELLASELIYAPLEIPDLTEGTENNLSALIHDLEANEDTVRVWTSVDT